MLKLKTGLVMQRQPHVPRAKNLVIDHDMRQDLMTYSLPDSQTCVNLAKRTWGMQVPVQKSEGTPSVMS